MRIIVVGAGVVGASAAYHLARSGAEVVVIDRAHDGRATAAGAGILCPWVSGIEDAGFYELYAQGARYYPELVAALAERGEADIGYRRSGAMCVSADTADLAMIERIVRQRAAQAPEAGDVTRLSPREARALFPPLNDELAAVHISGGARVDGRRLAASLMRAAIGCGAAYRSGLASLVASAERVTGVMLEAEFIPADTVIVAAGAWATSLLRPIGVRLEIMPQRGQIMHLRLAGEATGAWPVVLPLSGHYLLAFDDSRVVAGATREPDAEFDYRVTAAGQAELLFEALRVAPGLASAEVIETRVGFRPVGANGRPVLGPVPAVERLLIGNGLGAAGLTIGPLAGRLLAEVALGQQPGLDLANFAP